MLAGSHVTIDLCDTSLATVVPVSNNLHPYTPASDSPDKRFLGYAYFSKRATPESDSSDMHVLGAALG